MKQPEMISKINPDKPNKAKIVADFKEKEKTKALTTEQRLDRIEQILGITKADR